MIKCWKLSKTTVVLGGRTTASKCGSKRTFIKIISRILQNILWMRMPKKKVKKRLIEPKVRLLLWIYLYGIKDESNWLAKLAKEIDYSEGSLQTQIIDLQNKNLIKSLNPKGEGPPYMITDEGKNFLKPITFTTRIGVTISIWVGLWAIIYYLSFLNQPTLVIVYWLPLLVVSFAIFALILVLYPHLLLRLGKISY